MNLLEVLARAARANVPERHIDRIRQRIQTEAIDGPLDIYCGPGKGLVSGRPYSFCFDVNFPSSEGRKWVVYQDHR